MAPIGNTMLVNHHPLVSVVIPSKNRPELVVATLASVISQTYYNVEIIVVDDCSETPLAPVLHDKYGNKVLCLRNEQSLGGAASRNRGALSACGDYIAFLDDDDLWLPDKLDKQVNAFAKLKEDVGVVYCGFDFLVQDHVVSNQNRYHPDINLNVEVFEGCPVGSPTPLIRKDYFEMVNGFDTDLPSCQDWDLWIRLSKVCRFYPVRESLALYRIHGEQISTDLLKKIDGRKRILAKHYEDIKKHPRILSAHYRRIGALCVLADKYAEARKFYCKALANSMFDAVSLAHLILQVVCKPLEKRLIEHCSVNMIDGIKVIH